MADVLAHDYRSGLFVYCCRRGRLMYLPTTIGVDCLCFVVGEGG